MANGTEERSRHFVLDGVTEVEPYRSRQRGGSRSDIPVQDRQRHGASLMHQLAELRTVAAMAWSAQQESGLDDGLGLRIEFESFPDIDLAFESLARERSGIELLNVRYDEHRTYATVFVPDGRLTHFEGLLRDYLTEKRNRIGRSLDHKRNGRCVPQPRGKSGWLASRERRFDPGPNLSIILSVLETPKNRFVR